MYELINEPVEVFVDFTPEGPVPIAFSWKHREYAIDSVDFAHASHTGSDKLYHFAVTAKNETYKITFNPNTVSWKLDEIYEKNFVKNLSVNEAVELTRYRSTNGHKYKKTNSAYRLR